MVDSPAPPRKLRPGVPRRLEAICLKAISKDPDTRYATAEAMARDISRFLDGLPVSAYRENVIEKTERFVGRNKFIVVLILAYLLMRVLVLFFFGR